MPHDSVVAEKAFDVVLREPGDAVGIEVLKRGAKGVALPQNRQP
jgi:hypothetical protein